MDHAQATESAAAAAFIARWQGVTASELSTSQSFLIDLCHLLGVDVPHPTPERDYMFERPITFAHDDGNTSAGRIDLYRRGAFVLESKKLKQGVHTRGFDDAILRARSQAEAYARALPAAEGRPPFVVVVDVGHRIELYSEFSRSGGTYVPFPDPRSHRIALADLQKPEVRERLRKVWLDPLSLDPSRESARVTREIADRLAKLARSLEKAGHAPEAVAQFLMRCLFTMFAEDVKLLPGDSFRNLLLTHAEQPDVAMRMVGQLWRDMDTGGFSAVLAGEVLHFNGVLFKTPDTLPLDRDQVALLADAARARWQNVEPAIFGTLLERALSPADRHKLGAHYTPRAYVERLVLPTVIEPLRREWSDVQAAVLTLSAEVGVADEADSATARQRDSATARQRDSATAHSIALLRNFHHRLCNVRVLDPACGSGNFLYVTLEHLKRLEGEVLIALDDLGYRQTGLALDGERADAAGGETVDPHNLLGIEKNPRAAAIAEVVLWIGYLQWHFRTRGDVFPPQPVVRDFRNIENRDAVLAWDGNVEYVTDERGVPVTRWDGETMKASPVTGEPVPDESARIPVERYVNPRKAAWPEADFIVGNPPFIGKSRIRDALGDGYVDALRSAWSEVPESADFVMYWWHRAAELVGGGKVERFGLITTNSIKQTFNRRVVEARMSGKSPISIVMAIPDHPWVESSDGAAVRIAMTVGARGDLLGRVLTVSAEHSTEHEVLVDFREAKGMIHADLTIGPAISKAIPLVANERITSNGVMLGSRGFLVPATHAVSVERSVSRPIINGQDMVQKSRDATVIDLYGMSVDEARGVAPVAYQLVLDLVKPSRDLNRRASRRENWWLFSEVMPQLRRIIGPLVRYIATPETSKHRLFAFVDAEVLAEHPLIAIGLNDAVHLGVLSSTVHEVWALATGGTLEDRPRYNKSCCFETFPFPDFSTEADKKPSPSRGGLGGDGFPASPDKPHPHPGLPLEGEGEQRGPAARIRTLAEQLDAHRKRQQAAHPGLTLTGMYNVLDKLRDGEPLTAKERTVHEQGLVSVLRQLHDDLDAAVLAAYGWADLLPLLRIAHGNTSALLPPAGEEPAPAKAGVPRRADEGALDLALTGQEAARAFDDAILERLVTLNAQRAAEEARGQIRWLRPAFQNPEAHRAPEQPGLDTTTAEDDGAQPATTAPPTAKPMPWPKDAIDQVRAVADLLAASPVPLSIEEIAARFTARGPWKKRLPKLLEMLVALGRAQEQDGKLVAA